MPQKHSTRAPKAILAFGRLVSADQAFEDLFARGWRVESWEPTFVEPCDRAECRGEDKRILRCPPALLESWSPVGGEEPRVMIASASDLPTLHYVGWHYIDFVLSCVGNVTEAAQILGVRRSTLQRKRKKTPPMK